MAKLRGNTHAIAGIAGLLTVFVVSFLASTLIDALIVVPVAVVAAFGCGLLIRPNPEAEAEREAERIVMGEHLDRQVRSGRKLAILDPQTAMLQRWYFELRVAEESRRCRRYNASMAVIFVSVQDTVRVDEEQESRPWTQADEVDFVQMFGRTLRSVDLAARIQPRHYAVCLPHTGEEGAGAAVARLLKNAGVYQVSAFTALCPRDGSDFETLAEHATEYSEEAFRERASASPNGLLQLISTEPSGEVPVLEGQTIAAAKAKVRRAAKRAGIELRVWEESGAIHFERPEALEQEGVA